MIIIGVLFLIVGGITVYSCFSNGILKKNEKSNLLIGIIICLIGCALIYEGYEKKGRQERLEEERRLYESTHKKCQICEGLGCKWCHYKGYLDTTSFGHDHKTCGSTGCDCTIKRSELEAAELIRCSCGHLTSWHHD